MKKIACLLLISSLVAFTSCGPQDGANDTNKNPTIEIEKDTLSAIQKKVNDYALVELKTDLNKLTDKQKQIIPLLIKASKVMNGLYKYQVYPKYDSLVAATDDKATKKFIEMNFGPWDRLKGFQPFIDGVGEKPAGANFYPHDMTKEEFVAGKLEHKSGLYTFVRRDSTGELVTVPYHTFFKDELVKASSYLKEAAKLAENEAFKKYLNLRATALTTDEFHESDLAWLDMKDNTLGIVIGPIETYEDQLFGYKTSYEAYVLVKDVEWSKRLAKFAQYLPQLQENLPVPTEYKQEEAGSDADLNAYDVIYYSGMANAGGKTIAINLPNSEKVQLLKGTRRLQLKNVMRAKFEKILVPIASVLIDSTQRDYIEFNAFFSNTMFHEVAHGLGIKNTINGNGTVRKALKEHASALEEGKADILGLYMIQQLLEKGAIEGDIKTYYTTFVASVFRSVRFGAGDAHGIANMICFNYLREHGAFTRQDDGTYKVNYEKMDKVVKELSQLILTLQGDGNYEAVSELVAKDGVIGEQLQNDLDRLKNAAIPLDIVFEQGVDVLGL